MNIYSDLGAALQAVKRNYLGGKRLHVTFSIDQAKVEAKAAEWAEFFGTRDAPWRRQKQHLKGRPTAKAVCGPVSFNGQKRQLVLQATEFARLGAAGSPWSRERWSDRELEFGDFVLVNEPNRHGTNSWTWRLKPEVMEGRRRYLTHLVKAQDVVGVRNECETWIKLYPMQGGVRRQLQRTLTSAMKLWRACHGSPWPAITPEKLPMLIGFRVDGRLIERKGPTCNEGVAPERLERSPGSA